LRAAVFLLKVTLVCAGVIYSFSIFGYFARAFILLTLPAAYRLRFQQEDERRASIYALDEAISWLTILQEAVPFVSVQSDAQKTSQS